MCIRDSIGCVLDTEPAAGTTVKAGDTVTLTISRGINYGDSVQAVSYTHLDVYKRQCPVRLPAQIM